MRRFPLCPLLLALAAVPALATTYVLPPDEALVRQAEVVAQATVAAVEPAPIEGPPSTDYFVQIERVIKGYVAGGTVVVRTPGGIAPNGLGLRIWGSPRFREGDRLLLFLVPRRDGTYGVLHLMLGAFHERLVGGRRVAVRSLSEAVEVSLLEEGSDLGGAEPLRDFQGFVNWIGDLAEGRPRVEDYLLLDEAWPRAAERSELLADSCTHLNFRWFEFDRGEGVRWHVHEAGFNGAGAGQRSFERARRAWSRKSGLDVRLERSARTAASAGIGDFDGLNAVLFNDPNALVSGAFDCRDGGLASLTGIWFDNGRGQSCERISPGRKELFRGRQYLEILGADIVTNDGTACLFSGDPGITSQVLAHELGHSLGLSHGGAEKALMRGELRDQEPSGPGRADRRALGQLYRRLPEP